MKQQDCHQRHKAADMNLALSPAQASSNIHQSIVLQNTRQNRHRIGHKDLNLEGVELLKLFIHIDEHSKIESIYKQQNHFKSNVA